MKTLVTLLVALLGGLQQTKPVFRAATDLAVLDVVVVDKSGALVTSLKADDFVVSSKKGTRPIASLEFVSTRLPAARPMAIMPEPGLRPDRPSTNVGKPQGRSFMLAVDVGEIRAGEGRLAMQQIAQFVDALPSEDLVGLVVLPYGTPRVELTTDRKILRDTLAKTVGASDQYKSCEPTLGEAASLSTGDRSALETYFLRVYRLHCIRDSAFPTGARARDFRGIPGFSLNASLASRRMETRSTVDTLGALSDRMARLEGQKTIVLVSEGLYTDRDTRLDIARFGERAAAARVRLYALHLDTPVAEAAYTVPADTHNLDDHLGFDGMAEVAAITGGSALRVVARATEMLNRVDREASGYYLISVETDPAERDGTPVDMKVRLKTKGLEVLTRPAFVRAPTPTAKALPADLKSAIADTLRWPVDEAEMRINLDVIRMVDDRTIIVAEFQEAPVALGFEVTDSAGKVVADTYESPVAAVASEGRTLYVGSITLPAGHYTLKLAALDRGGHRGAVSHMLHVQSPAVASLRMSDILLGTQNSDPWAPIAQVMAGQKQAGIRVDFAASTAGALAGATVMLRVGRIGQTGWLAESNLPITSLATVPLTRTARGGVNIATLAKGDYVLKVDLMSGATVVTSTAKILRID